MLGRSIRSRSGGKGVGRAATTGRSVPSSSSTDLLLGGRRIDHELEQHAQRLVLQDGPEVQRLANLHRTAFGLQAVAAAELDPIAAV